MNHSRQHEWQWESLDYQLANYVSRFEGESYSLKQAVQILSHEVRQGHVCILLDDFENFEINDSDRTPAVAEWNASLLASEATGLPHEIRPLILDEKNRLYFHRYWQYEHQLAKWLLRKTKSSIEAPDDQWLVQQVESLKLSGQQKQAVKNAIQSSLSIISGGPGTGKTSTIASLLVLLQRFQPDLRVALAAPTGKAAARMQQAIAHSASQFSAEEAELLPKDALTLHRLLGYRPGKISFRHNQSNPLPYHVVIVDEASMIDLALINKLVSAIGEDSRLILIGDKFQLASVEAGSVFGEICSETHDNPITKKLGLLTESFRFESGQGIGKLATSINSGNIDNFFNLLQDKKYPEIQWLNPEMDPDTWQETLKTGVSKQLKNIQAESSAEAKFSRLGEFQVLCAHQSGKYGVEGIAKSIDRWINSRSSQGEQEWYSGKPLMVTENDYQTQLFNGDFGLVVSDNQHQPKVIFQNSSELSVAFSLARLPAYVNAWAISVHKSQGSEFNEVILIMPEILSPVLSRELLYTAVTRAKTRITIISNEKVLRHAVLHQVQRRSGLSDKLLNNNKQVQDQQLSLFTE